MSQPQPPYALGVEASRILVADDEPRNVLLLRRILEGAGFREIAFTTRSHEIVGLCLDSLPDLLILDLHMPEPDGFAVLEELGGRLGPDAYLPVLVLTADGTERTRRRALSLGARDFLTKPFGVTEAILRIRNLLETRWLYHRLEERNADLTRRVAERTRELENARVEVLERLSQAVEFRDDITGKHTRRVGEQSAALAAAVGLDATEVDMIRRAAPLHDVGKIGIPDAILQKPGKLTASEVEVMRSHTVVGGRILAGGATPLMATAESIALAHHERWDGGGYPQGLSCHEIPLAARIVAVVDVFDAVSTPRHYREAWPKDRALEEIRRGAGRHFDPELASLFVELAEDLPP